MSHRTVGDVMMRDVVAAVPSTPFNEIVGMLTFHRLSAVPVVDRDRRPVGIVSEADLLLKRELAGAPVPPPTLPALDRWLRRRAQGEAAALCAEQVMTTSVLTLHADRLLADAARVLHVRRLRHALVVDGAGRLIGMVARSDLLKPFAMDDDALRLAILIEVLVARLRLPWDAVRVEVVGGVVTLRGQLDRRRDALAVRQAVEAQPGVLAVVDVLTYARDDGGTDDLRRPDAAAGGKAGAGWP